MRWSTLYKANRERSTSVRTNREKYEIEARHQDEIEAGVRTSALYINDGRARCPRCAVVLNDERRPADFTDHMSGINLCPDCLSNEAERLASTTSTEETTNHV